MSLADAARELDRLLQAPVLRGRWPDGLTTDDVLAALGGAGPHTTLLVWGSDLAYGRRFVQVAEAAARACSGLRLADGMESMLDLCALLADDERNDIRIEAALVKLFSSEMAWKVADDLVQLRGGRGFERADSLAARGEKAIAAEQMLRDLRIERIFEGSTEIMHLLIEGRPSSLSLTDIGPGTPHAGRSPALQRQVRALEANPTWDCSLLDRASGARAAWRMQSIVAHDHLTLRLLRREAIMHANEHAADALAAELLRKCPASLRETVLEQLCAEHGRALRARVARFEEKWAGGPGFLASMTARLVYDDVHAGWKGNPAFGFAPYERDADVLGAETDGAWARL